MAVLSAADRALLTAEIQRTPDSHGAITKAQRRAVYDALDDWWETTGAALGNAAIPLPQRTNMTPKQKAAVFMRLLRRKYEVT